MLWHFDLSFTVIGYDVTETKNNWDIYVFLGKQAEQVGSEAGEELVNNLFHGGCVDDYIQDQVSSKTEGVVMVMIIW